MWVNIIYKGLFSLIANKNKYNIYLIIYVIT